ncbi:putative phage abortive infection protein [Parapedobacter sp. GCM10030251]|uniref:putative phage abortive infection protein n=1 Tax=Parapedobacter sp. GCM10030251 TaxID=3273419 RepID=UPI00361F3958
MTEKKLKVRNRYGRNTFDFVLTQIIQCYEDLEPFFNKLGIEDVTNEKRLSDIKLITQSRTKINPIHWIRMDFAYIITFMGLSEPGQKAIESVFSKFYSSSFVKSILFFLSKKPHKDSIYYSNWKALCKNNFLKGAIVDDFQSVFKPDGSVHNDLNFNTLVSEEGKYYRFYGGHQYKLSHYFRHLYQIVKYFNGQKVLTYEEKYKYASILTAQLSTPEQILFFVNSISTLGLEWELGKIIYDDINDYLITKYNLIRNIHDITLNGKIDIRSFYPEVVFQFEEYPNERDSLKRDFK